MKKLWIILSTLTLTAAVATAQPQPAPRDKATTTVAGHALALEYGQPSLNGRSLDQLMSQLSADRMWRAGSEQVTTLTTQGPISVGGTKVPAGKYSVYLHCGEDKMSLVLNSVVGQPLKQLWDAAPADMADEPWPHFSYADEIGDSEVARVPMVKIDNQPAQDRLKFAFREGDNSSVLAMSWGDQTWAVRVTPAQ